MVWFGRIQSQWRLSNRETFWTIRIGFSRILITVYLLRFLSHFRTVLYSNSGFKGSVAPWWETSKEGTDLLLDKGIEYGWMLLFTLWLWAVQLIHFFEDHSNMAHEFVVLRIVFFSCAHSAIAAKHTIYATWTPGPRLTTPQVPQPGWSLLKEVRKQV